MGEQFRVLPRLAFGEEGAGLRQDLNTYRDRLAGVVTGLSEVGSTGTEPFSYKSCNVVINGLQILASCRTPVRLRTNKASEPIAGLLLSGHGTYVFDGKRSDFHAGNLMYVPEDEREARVGTCSTVNLALERARLHETFHAIAGKPPGPRQLARLSMLRISQAPGCDVIMKQMSAIITAIEMSFDDPRPLEILGVDQVLYRLVAATVWPELLRGEDAQASPPDLRERAMLSRLRDHVHANLDKPLQLTSLAILAGTSTRRVREIFLREFGVTPAEYIRDARLVHARHLLETALEKRIRDIASALGFTRASLFAAQYRQRFGETPTTTRSRAEGRRLG
jgi:AraC-like DNA-binding protein